MAAAEDWGMSRVSFLKGTKPLGIVALATLSLSACSDGSQISDAQDQPLPSVVVEAVTAKDVADQVDFVGRTEASQRVDVRARINGTLLKRPFDEGAEVEKDAVLFEIDPAEFQANLLAAEAQLAKTEASLNENDRNLKRYEVLLERETASEAQYDIAKSKADQSRADVSAAQAEVERAKLDLSYATIRSPIAGRSGLSDADVGNIIGPDSGVLVTVLDLDPMDVIFSVGERDYLNFMEARKEGKAEDFTPQIRLANDKLYEFPGKVDVVDNKVDPATGTINVRLEFPNPDRILVPGQYVSVILTRATPEKRVVIPQASVQENQAGPFVLVVNGEGRVEARPVKTGERVGDGVVVLDGLTEGETLVVEGIQKVRPGAEVQTAYRTSAEEPETIEPPDEPGDNAPPEGEP
jgi:membrane fusion protein (multidrug efflux system)